MLGRLYGASIEACLIERIGSNLFVDPVLHVASIGKKKDFAYLVDGINCIFENMVPSKLMRLMADICGFCEALFWKK